MKKTGRGKSKTLALGLMLGFLCSSSVFAAEGTPKDTAAEPNAPAFGFDIAIGTELMSGDTTYSIGYPITVIGGGVDSYSPLPENQLKISQTSTSREKTLTNKNETT